MSSGSAKTGNAKDKGRGHDDEKEGEEEEGTSRGREGERVRDGLVRASVNDDRAGVTGKSNKSGIESHDGG